MSIGISLPGTYPLSGLIVKGPSPSEWLASFQEWLRAREGDALVLVDVVEGADGEVLLARLHPFAEDLQVTCARPGHVLLTIQTGSCGPGLHAHVVDLAHAMADELKVTWHADEPGHGDDTGYFLTGDREALERAMIAHVSELARLAVRRGDVAPALLMPHDAALPVGDAAVVTPMGPRDDGWLAAVREGDARALDAMPWRSTSRGAAALERALAACWCDVRWRAPAHEHEVSLLQDVSGWLRQAHGAGETNIPWAEWAALAGWLEEEIPAASGGSRPVGYRRGDMRVPLPGNFSIRLPGSFSEEIDEDGTWHGEDGTRSVFASAGRVPNASDGPGDAVRALARMPFSGEPFEMLHAGVAGKAGLRQDEDDDGEKVWVLSCGAAQGPTMLRATILFHDDADRDWALATFRSIGGGAAEIATGGSSLPGITG